MIYQIYNKSDSGKGLTEKEIIKIIEEKIKDIFEIPIDKLLLKDILTNKIHELFLEDDVLSTKNRPDLDEIELETKV